MNVYDFYNLPFKERDKVERFEDKAHIYYVFRIDKNLNYQKSHGVLVLIKPIALREDVSQKAKDQYAKSKYGNLNWFKLGAVSPDDLDCDLEFEEPEQKYEEVLNWMNNNFSFKDQEYTYKEILKYIHSIFGGKLWA